MYSSHYRWSSGKTQIRLKSGFAAVAAGIYAKAENAGCLSLEWARWHILKIRP
jgi:hypothetical protein